MAKKKLSRIGCAEIIGEHPAEGNPFNDTLTASDSYTDSGIPHRELNEVNDKRDKFINFLREKLKEHHTSPEMRKRDLERIKAMKRQKLDPNIKNLRRFPVTSVTRKGNLAEVFLAEYLCASKTVEIPVYRLRYNPNVEQSMKGDDVIAFDLNSNPRRIIVGEAKFRKNSSKQSVEDIVDALSKSHIAGLPISLIFVADRLFEKGENELGEKVMECSTLFAENQLQLDYAGLLMSDRSSAEKVKEHAPKSRIDRLAILSFGMNDPESIIDPCYNDLEEMK